GSAPAARSRRRRRQRRTDRERKRRSERTKRTIQPLLGGRASEPRVIWTCAAPRPRAGAAAVTMHEGALARAHKGLRNTNNDVNPRRNKAKPCRDRWPRDCEHAAAVFILAIGARIIHMLVIHTRVAM